ncbi:hypothetical protein HFD88_010632 [Aspergillus terreus]|nr:hypothetical protein HFD88_010632 [Aspergillus terreus]
MITDSVPWIEQCMIKLPILHGRAILTSAGQREFQPFLFWYMLTPLERLTVCIECCEYMTPHFADIISAVSFADIMKSVSFPAIEYAISTDKVHSFFRQCKTKRESPTMTTDGDVNPTNDGTVNNNVSFLRFC